MNVLQVVLTLDIGGLERFLMEFVINLPTDIRPSVVCLEKKGALGGRFGDVPVFELNKSPGVHLSTVYQLAKIIRRHKIDIVHTHNPAPHFYGSLAGFLTRTPVIHTKHGRNRPDDRGELALTKISNRLTDFIVPVSNNAADLCVTLQHADRSKIRRIYNGIDLTRFFRRASRKEKLLALGIPDGCTTAGMVARICEDKDHETLINSLKYINCGPRNFRLLIIGDGPLREKMQFLVASLGVGEYVFFTGMRDDIPELLSELDFCILSTNTEGHSITLLEAMAAKLPCIATGVGGNSEVIEDGVTGFLVPHRNPKALAEKIRFIILNPEAAKIMGEAGRTRVKERFNIQETVKQYIDLYQSFR
jgi:glycosyltransferase involved in cell wall biosynthesis